MLTLTATFGLGAFCAFWSSTPLGPINLRVADLALRGRSQATAFFIGGVIAADVLCAALAILGYGTFVSQGAMGRTLGIAAASFLLFCGIYGVLRYKNRTSDVSFTNEHVTRSADAPFRQAVLGALLCIGNPGFWAFWTASSSLAFGPDPENLQISKLAAFLLGLLLGDGLWFFLFLKIMSRGRSALTERRLAMVRLVLSASMAILGMILLSRWSLS